MLGERRLHFRMFVAPVVIEDEVNRHLGRNGSVDFGEQEQELPVPVAYRQARTKRQDRLRAIQRLRFRLANQGFSGTCSSRRSTHAAAIRELEPAWSDTISVGAKRRGFSTINR